MSAVDGGGEDNDWGPLEGTALDVTKKVAPGWLNALLQPSTEIIGKRLRDRVEQWVAPKIIEKQNTNLQSHVNRVRAVCDDSKFEELFADPRQKDLFLDWAKEAEKVDADNNTISAVFEGILKEVLESDRDSSLLVASIRDITYEEIYFFLPKDFIKHVSPKKMFIVDKLTQRGILRQVRFFEKKKARIYINILILLCIMNLTGAGDVITLAIMAFMTYGMSKERFELPVNYISQILPSLVSLTLFIFIFPVMLKIYSIYNTIVLELTEIGTTIVTRAREMAQDIFIDENNKA